MWMLWWMDSWVDGKGGEVLRVVDFMGLKMGGFLCFRAFVHEILYCGLGGARRILWVWG